LGKGKRKRPEDESKKCVLEKKKIFMIEEDMKFITKETMDDTDLLIDIHNSLVYPPYKP